MIKTIENITAQSIKIGYTFANENMVKNVLKLMTGCKNENIKNTCVVVLGHICRVNYECIYHVYENLKIKGLIGLFVEINSKALQAILNIFNLGFQSNEYNIKLKTYFDQFTDKSHLTKTIIQLFDHQSIQIRGKSMLTISFLIRYDCT